MGNNLCPGSSGNNTSLSRSYTFDGFNQLVSVKNGANADIAQYSYYPDGLRRSKTVNGTTENYINQDGNAVAKVDANGNITAGYLYGLSREARFEDDEYTFFVSDGQGSIVLRYDSDGNTVTDTASFYRYDAYGKDITGGSSQNPFRYRGEFCDNETDLIYLRGRYYDPTTGRFISEDPAKDGFNWYAYCANDPVNYIDPSGLDAVLITAAAAAMHQGHTSILTQDNKDKNWYYFYWGDKAAYFVEVPWEDGVMNSLNDFNSWLDNQDLPYSTKNYTSATFVEGDFKASVDYFKELVDNTTIESGYRKEAGRYDKPTLEYYQIDASYSLLNANCLQMSMEGFYKGTLKNGTSVDSFMNGQLEKKAFATVRPNTAEKVFNQLFFNRSFSRVAAKNDVIRETFNGSPSDEYKTKGFFYAKTLGVFK